MCLLRVVYIGVAMYRKAVSDLQCTLCIFWVELMSLIRAEAQQPSLEISSRLVIEIAYVSQWRDRWTSTKSY